MTEEAIREREEAEGKAKRIERWHQSGRVFQSSRDLPWLFVELALANGGELDWSDRSRLTDLVAEPIWGSLWDHHYYCSKLMEQGAIFVENSKFHCTALRDFLILRMVSCLVKDMGYYERKPKKRFWHLLSFAVILMVFAYRFWLGIVLTALYILSEAVKGKARYRWRQQRMTVESVENVIRRGGFDEPEVIRTLERLQQSGTVVPSVLYALLRLPRRNAENDVFKAYSALDDEKKRAIWEKWQAFLDSMLKNDDGEAAKKAFDILESHRAEIFKPVRNALDQLAPDFAADTNIVLTSKSHADMFPSTYSIEINEDGNQQYYIYMRCEKYTLEDQIYFFPMCVTRNPGAYSTYILFYPWDEEKIAPTVKTLLLHYRQHGELTPGDVERVSECVKSGSVEG